MSYMKKFIPCRNCPRKDNITPLGYYYSEKNGYQILIECDCHKKWRKEKDFEVSCEISSINKNYSFDSYLGDKSKTHLMCLMNFALNFKNFVDKKVMIYLYGPNGTQKTSIAMAAGKEIIKQGYKVQYILMNNLITTIIENTGPFNNEEEPKSFALYERCKECDLLIIDESFDKSKVTLYKSGYQIPFLDSFLRERLEVNNKNTMFISNTRPSQIAGAGYEKSLQDLVERNTKSTFLEFYDNYAECNVKSLSPESFFGVNNGR